MKRKTLFAICFLLLRTMALQAQEPTPFEGDNKKWGFKDNKGAIVVPAKYSYVDNFADGLAPVNIGGIWLENQDHISGGKWGYINKTGKEIVSLKYDDARMFKQGVAMVGVKAEPLYRYGLINTEGKEIVPTKYDFIYDPEHGVAAYELKEKVGLIDITNGKELLPADKYNSLDPSYLSNGLIKAGVGMQNSRKFGLITKSGKEIVPPIYDLIAFFKNGKAKVRIGTYQNKREGMIDTTGKVIVPLKYKTLWDNFEDGLALFQTVEDKYGFINESGKEVIPALTQYNNVNSFQPTVGLAKVFVGKFPNSKGGFIDRTGKEIIPPKYDQLGDYFSDGLISVGIGPKKERKFGYIDPSGKEVIPMIYKQAGVFKSGRAQVTDFNNRTFYIDKTGKEIN